MITLSLPWPVSANRYWITVVNKKTLRAMTFPSNEAQAYREQVGWLARAAGVKQPLAGPIEVTLTLYPQLPKDWAKRAKDDPAWWDLSVRTIDLDNSQKVVWDSLKNIAFTDDRMIRKAHSEIAVPDGEARVVVTIQPYERAHPNDALFAREPVYVPRETIPSKGETKRAKRETRELAPALADIQPEKDPF